MPGQVNVDVQLDWSLADRLGNAGNQGHDIYSGQFKAIKTFVKS